MPATLCFASLLQNKLKSDKLIPPTIINLSNQVVAIWEKLLEKVESIILATLATDLLQDRFDLCTVYGEMHSIVFRLVL